MAFWTIPVRDIVKSNQNYRPSVFVPPPVAYFISSYHLPSWFSPLSIIIAVSQSVLHSASQLGTVSPPGAFLKCLVTFFVCVAMPEGKLLTFSGKRPGMLRSQQSMRQHAQLSAQNVRSIPIKKQWTSWIGTPVLGWLNWFLPLKQVIYSGPLQCASGPRQWLGLLSPSFGFSLRGQGYLAKRNSGNVLVLVYPIPFCWEADAENSASGRFTDTCLLRCLQLHKWKLTQQVQKMNVSVISFYCCYTASKQKGMCRTSVLAEVVGQRMLPKVLRMQCLCKEKYRENISDWCMRWLFDFFIKD